MKVFFVLCAYSRFFCSSSSFDMATLGVRHSRRTLGLIARIQRNIRADYFGICVMRYCRAECVLLPWFNPQFDIFAAMIASS